MVDFIKCFFKIKKINFLLTFLSLLNFGIMFGAEEDEEKYKIKIKFEKKDMLEKKPFAMFWENFCEKFGLEVKNFEGSDIRFYYRDDDGDAIYISENDNFKDFYTNNGYKEKKSTTRHLFLEKNKDDNKIKVYDNIINNKNFKDISITVYVDEDLDKKDENNNIENNLNGKGDKKNNGDVNKNKNNDCPCCNCCLDCF